MARIPHESHADRQARHAQHIELLSRLFEPDQDELSCEPAEAARYFQILALGGSHPHLSGGRVLTPAEITSLLLNGIHRR
jgi:hypothetical protein